MVDALKMKALEAWAGELKSGMVVKTRKLKAMPKQVAAEYAVGYSWRGWRRVQDV
jgi:hypothetical protein